MQESLRTAGFVLDPGPFATYGAAWVAAQAMVARADVGARLTVIGDFVIPPLDAPPSRDFQTLHIDFGLPLVPVTPADVARFTALYVTTEATGSQAATRLVPLRALFGCRPWPNRDELVRRLSSYGRSHGAWNDADGYTEGSLARIIEAALGQEPVLPSVKAEPEFLCGNEFSSLEAELEFLVARDVDPRPAQVELSLRPGELLVFDNLAFAHGRRGSRRPGELHQRIFGHRALPVGEQLRLRDRVLEMFDYGSVPVGV